MDDRNIIELLDKVRKNIERGAGPIAVQDINATISLLETKIAKNRGKRFEECHIKQPLPNQKLSEMELDIIDTRQKLNQLIRFFNERYQ
jgi:hypothetical protein